MLNKNFSDCFFKEYGNYFCSVRISLITLFILFGFSVTAQNWSLTTIPHGRNIFGIHIFNQENIAVAGGNLQNDALQSIFLSGNSGLTWNVNHDFIAPMINSIDFFDTTGFAVGNEGIMLKSSNGGQNWTSVNSGISRQLNEIKYLNDSTLIAVGGNDTYQSILFSSDGGNNWVLQHDIPGSILRSVFFTDLQHGVAVGINTILITSDGGLNWLPVSSPIVRDFNSVTFAGSSIGYIAGGDTASGVNRTILKTINGGSSWIVQSDENAAPFYDIFFLNPDTGYVVGDSSKVLKTMNGGASWFPQNLNTSADSLRLNCVEFLNDSFGVIGSRFGNVFIYNAISLPEATTSGAVVTNQVNASMGAIINGYGTEFVYTFLFSLDSNLLSYSETLDAVANNNNPTSYAVNIPNLQNDTIYYYTVKVRNIAGTVYGDTVPFYTGQIYAAFSTLPATQITSNSARFNAEISGFIYPVSLEFEYGFTESFGNSILATPAQISDTQPHQIYADISSLQPDSYYYFRLKGTLPNGSAIYGQTLFFYNGENTIPNWDFQLWDEDTIAILAGWNFYGEGFEQVAGHSGNYALKVDEHAIALLGEISNNGSGDNTDFIGGVPFTYRPDSVTFYMNYFVQPEDTAIFLVKLYSGTNTISLNFFPITGNSSNQFQRMAYAIDYNNSAIPDSLVLGLVPLNPFDTIDLPNSSNYLIIDDISFGTSSPSFLNDDFENWVDYTHPRVAYWGLKNFYSDSQTEPLMTRTFFEQPADYAIKIKTRTNSEGDFFGPSLATGNNIFNENEPDFEVNQRHLTLNAFYQYQPENSDTMEVSVTMFKNGIQIGNGTFNQHQTVTEFTPMTLNINYQYPLLIPDSASIEVSPFARYMHGESYVIIDKMQFDNPGIPTSIEQSDASDFQAMLYPNPGSNKLSLFIKGYQEQSITLELFSATGKQVYIQTYPADESIIINTEFLSEGVYFVKIFSTNQVKTLKWIKQ